MLLWILIVNVKDNPGNLKMCLFQEVTLDSMLHKRSLLNSWLPQVISIINNLFIIINNIWSGDDCSLFAGLTAAQGGLPAAYASAPAAATTPTGAGQAQPAETRTQ